MRLARCLSGPAGSCRGALNRALRSCVEAPIGPWLADATSPGPPTTMPIRIPCNRAQYEPPFIQMNGGYCCVQHALSGAVSLWAHDREPGHPDGPFGDEASRRRLKTISAALLVASVFVAPAMAGSVRTGHAPAVKSVTLESNVLNANAKMGHHHHSSRHVHHHHHHHHYHHSHMPMHH